MSHVKKWILISIFLRVPLKEQLTMTRISEELIVDFYKRKLIREVELSSEQNKSLTRDSYQLYLHYELASALANIPLTKLYQIMQHYILLIQWT